MDRIKDSVRHDYEIYVKRKLLSAKNKIALKWRQRQDYDAILSVRPYRK